MGVQVQLSILVKEFINEQGGETDKNYMRYLGFGIRALRALHLDVSGAPKWDYLTVDENSNTVELPNDCIRVLNIGEVTKNNYLKPLILKDNMLLNSDASQGFKSYIFLDSSGTSYPFGQDAIRGEAYRQDYLNNTIKVSSGIRSGCLYIEYLPDMEKVDGAYMVHPYYFEAIIAYIRWADVRSNPNVSRGTIDDYKREWLNEKRTARNRQHSMTLQQVIAEVRETYTAAPRL